MALGFDLAVLRRCSLGQIPMKNLSLKRRRRRMTKTNLIGPVDLCASVHGYWRGYDDFGCKISKKLPLSW